MRPDPSRAEHVVKGSTGPFCRKHGASADRASARAGCGPGRRRWLTASLARPDRTGTVVGSDGQTLRAFFSFTMENRVHPRRIDEKWNMAQVGKRFG